MTALKTERVPVMFDTDRLRKVDNYRFENRIGTRAEAIRKLIDEGLTASNIETKKADATA